MLTSSPAQIWEVCSATGEKVARITALPTALFLEICPGPLLHQLGGRKGRGREGKALCKLRKLPHCPTMSECFKWWGKSFPEKHDIACHETRIEHTSSSVSAWKLGAFYRRRMGRCKKFSFFP